MEVDASKSNGMNSREARQRDSVSSSSLECLHLSVCMRMRDVDGCGCDRFVEEQDQEESAGRKGTERKERERERESKWVESSYWQSALPLVFTMATVP